MAQWFALSINISFVPPIFNPHSQSFVSKGKESLIVYHLPQLQT